MRLIGLTICRNEAWCVEASITSSLRWCDAVVVLDHASQDRTPQILSSLEDQYPGRIHRMADGSHEWLEMSHRQRTLERARQEGATHCAIVDCDEILTDNLVPVIRGWMSGLRPGEVLQIPWVTCWRSLDRYLNSDRHSLAGAMVSVGFADTPALQWHQRPDGYEFHHREPYNSTAHKKGEHGQCGLLHLQHVNWRRLCAKQALYQCIEILRWGTVRANYAGTVNEAGVRTAEIPAEWWGAERSMLEPDAVPWQEAEVHRLIKQHGRKRFAAVNFFGVA